MSTYACLNELLALIGRKVCSVANLLPNIQLVSLKDGIILGRIWLIGQTFIRSSSFISHRENRIYRWARAYLTCLPPWLYFTYAGGWCWGRHRPADISWQIYWSTWLFNASFATDVLWYTKYSIQRSINLQPSLIGPFTCLFIGTPCPWSPNLALFWPLINQLNYSPLFMSPYGFVFVFSLHTKWITRWSPWSCTCWEDFPSSLLFRANHEWSWAPTVLHF